LASEKWGHRRNGEMGTFNLSGAALRPSLARGCQLAQSSAMCQLMFNPLRLAVHPKKQHSGSASISCTKSIRSLLVEGPGYSCHRKSARIQYSRHFSAERTNLSLATGDSPHSCGLFQRADAHRSPRRGLSRSTPEAACPSDVTGSACGRAHPRFARSA
jgi:hypothetical protein